MIILAYIWVFCLIITALFIVVAIVIEKNFGESHPVKIWWRKNVIGLLPNDEDI